MGKFCDHFLVLGYYLYPSFEFVAYEININKEKYFSIGKIFQRRKVNGISLDRKQQIRNLDISRATNMDYSNIKFK